MSERPRNRPLQRHPDPSLAGDARSHGERRGRRRAAQRGPDGARAVLHGGGAARQGRGAVPALRDDVQRDRIPHPHPARRRDHPAREQPRPALRGRRPRRALGGDAAPAARRARDVHRRAGARGGPWQQPALPALSTGLRREHHQPRRRGGVERRRPRRDCRCRPRARALHPHGRRPADECGCGFRGARGDVRARLGLRVDRHEQGARRAGRRRARGLARLHRAGAAAQAPVRRRDAPGRHHRRGRGVRADGTTSTGSPRTTTTRSASRGSSHRSTASGSTRTPSRPT